MEDITKQQVSQKNTSAVASLRLNTDWYESTKHELEHLFPRLLKMAY